MSLTRSDHVPITPIVRPTLLFMMAQANIHKSSTHKSLSVAWNNTFRRIFNTCWRERERALDRYSSIVAVYRLLFWSTNASCCFEKKMMTSNNALLIILARTAQSQMFALASKYGITQLFSCSINFVKNRVFSAVASTVL